MARQILNRKRGGLSMIEMIACLVLMAMMLVIIGKVSLARTQDSMNIDAQYRILAADGWLADIYRDYHAATAINYVRNDATGENDLHFTMLDGSENVYSFSSETGYCYTNGVEQFQATRFEVTGTGRNIDVSVKIPSERLLTINIYE